ncbi:MAG: hypothetical protein A7315_05280 [Candidatus Altiarchaeales archaeon WOR_SM1_79]|nr:MAG: hypothetical protein A7315_05280 [Candidatus Altiarchaeales archaeon WOR_SM1_79]
MNYNEAIDYLYNLKIYGMSLGLERIEYLLNVLGSPHKDMKAIHVAGTNGKGSVSAMLSSILQSAGYKVGLFTSPHLVSFEERIVVNGKWMSKDKVCLLVEKIKPIASDMQKSGKFEHPTFFEIVTAMGFEHFKEEEVDFAVLEVGLGGRLDATNVISPLVSIITTIALDHTHVLGETLEQVAREKAGIIKKGVPVVTGVENEEILDLIKDTCKKKNCEVFPTKKLGAYLSKKVSLDGQIFNLKVDATSYNDMKMHLIGEHQLKNALIAAHTIKVLNAKGLNISEKNIREGFEKTRWLGRLELVQKEPTVILDCAHNPAGMKALKNALVKINPKGNLTLVLGIMRDKDISGIVEEIAPCADRVIVTKPKFERAAEPKIIEKEVKKFCNNIITKSIVKEAVWYAINDASFEDFICITGSIYLVGEAMVELGLSKPRKNSIFL